MQYCSTKQYWTVPISFKLYQTVLNNKTGENFAAPRLPMEWVDLSLSIGGKKFPQWQIAMMRKGRILIAMMIKNEEWENIWGESWNNIEPERVGREINQRLSDAEIAKLYSERWKEKGTSQSETLDLDYSA